MAQTIRDWPRRASPAAQDASSRSHVVTSGADVSAIIQGKVPLATMVSGSGPVKPIASPENRALLLWWHRRLPLEQPGVASGLSAGTPIRRHNPFWPGGRAPQGLGPELLAGRLMSWFIPRFHLIHVRIEIMCGTLLQGTYRLWTKIELFGKAIDGHVLHSC